MKMRIIDGVQLKVISCKNYINYFLTHCYDAIYHKYDFGCVPIHDNAIDLDASYLVNDKHFYRCLRYNSDMVFVDMKTKEIMVRI